MIKKTKEVYTVIQDEEALKDFIAFLPELQKGSAYFFTLLGRRKYATTALVGFNSERAVLTSFICTNKRQIFEIISRLEVPMGSYSYRKDEVVCICPNEILALYMQINPISLKHASYLTCKKLNELVYNNDNRFNPLKELFAYMQISTFNRKFVQFDFDNVTKDDVISQIREKDILPLSCICVTETRTGIHLFVNKDVVNNKTHPIWYQKIGMLPGCDAFTNTLSKVQLDSFIVHEDDYPLDNENLTKKLDSMLTPVPGTIQGRHCPIFHKPETLTTYGC